MQPSSSPARAKLTRPSPDEYGVVELDLRGRANNYAMDWVYPMWINSLKNEGGWGLHGGTGNYHREQSHLIDSIMGEKATRVLMLVHKADPEVFFGFICGVDREDYRRDESGVLIHYMAVKSGMRGYGLSHVLLDEMIDRCGAGPLECSHTTRSWRKLPRGKAVNYNPYALIWSLT